MSSLRRLGTALCSLLLVAAAADPALAAEATPTWKANSGMAIPGTRLAWGSEAQLNQDLDRVAASGVSWLRFDVPWSQISWEPGQADWSRVDRIIDGARARGLKPLGILGTLAPYVRPAGSTWQYGPRSDAERAGFAAFARQAATRYATKVTAWEVWNEPNLDQSWAPQPSSADYAKLLQVTTPAIKSACPTCTVLSGGTGGSTGLPDIDPLTWYRGVYAAKANTLFDVLAVHPYSDRVHGWGGEMSVIPAIRSLMDANGDAGKRIWGTEAGSATGGETGVSESDSARIMTEAADAWTKIPNVGPLFWYTLQDTDDPSSEGFMGLLRRDGSPKPTWSVLQTLTSKPWVEAGATTDLSGSVSTPAPVATILTANVTATGSNARGTLSLNTQGRLAAKTLIFAVRDANGRNWDMLAARDVVLTGTQEFIAARYGLPHGLYRYGVAYQGLDGVWRGIGPEGRFSVGQAVTPSISVPELSLTSTVQGSTATATLSTLGLVSAKAVIMAVRDAKGANFDVWMAQNVTLGGVQRFTGGKAPLPPGTYTYQVAYRAESGRWYGVGSPKTLKIG